MLENSTLCHIFQDIKKQWSRGWEVEEEEEEERAIYFYNSHVPRRQFQHFPFLLFRCVETLQLMLALKQYENKQKRKEK